MAALSQIHRSQITQFENCLTTANELFDDIPSPHCPLVQQLKNEHGNFIWQYKTLLHEIFYRRSGMHPAYTATAAGLPTAVPILIACFSSISPAWKGVMLVGGALLSYFGMKKSDQWDVDFEDAAFFDFDRFEKVEISIIEKQVLPAIEEEVQSSEDDSERLQLEQLKTNFVALRKMVFDHQKCIASLNPNAPLKA